MTQLDPMDQLREQFRAAAARDIERHQRRRWRPNRRWLAIGAVALVGTTGVATAVELIAVGDDAPGNRESARRFGVRTDQGRVAVQTDDPGRALPWAVVTYQRGDRRCAMTGELRGNELGVLEDGTFRPFGSGAGGACGRPGSDDLFLDVRFLDDRAIFYGRAAPDVRTVEARFPGGARTVHPDATGAFLFVFDASTRLSDVKLVGRRADGSTAFGE